MTTFAVGLALTTATACSGPSTTAQGAAGSLTPTVSSSPTDSGTVSSPGPSSGATIVPSQPVTSAPAVPLTTPSDLGQGITVSLAGTAAVVVESAAPGDANGPAVSVDVVVDNTGNAPVDLGNVVVAVTDASGSPVAPVAGPPTSPFTGTVAPGRQASAVYAFSVAVGARDRMTVTVSISAGFPVATFTGNLPD